MIEGTAPLLFAGFWVVYIAAYAVPLIAFRLGVEIPVPWFTKWQCLNCETEHLGFLGGNAHCDECGELNWTKAARSPRSPSTP